MRVCATNLCPGGLAGDLWPLRVDAYRGQGGVTVSVWSWEIVGTYQGHREVIDTTDSQSNAHYLANEYRLAYGPFWSIRVRRVRVSTSEGDSCAM